MKNWYPYSLIFIVSEQQHKYLCSALELQTINEVTANDRFSGNDQFSRTKNPDRFFHYNGRWLYYLLYALLTEFTKKGFVKKS